MLCAGVMRPPTDSENEVLNILLAKAKLKYLACDLKVESMEDGNMGSLKIGFDYDLRRFGECVAEFEFKDCDQVAVLASLNLDTEGNLYELDVCKSDFSATQFLRSST